MLFRPRLEIIRRRRYDLPPMGIYDRDYYRQSLPRGGFGVFNAWSVTTWLIVINIVIFFMDAALFRATHARPRELYDDPDSVQYVQRSREAMLFDSMGPLQRWG